MANIKISQMVTLATMTDTALIPVVDVPFNKKITGLIAKTYMSASPILTGTPSSTGIFTINYTGSSDSSLVIAGSNTRGGAGFHDFLVAKNGASGATNTNKFFRLNSTGGLEIVNSAYSSVILRLTDTGQLALGGTAADVNITTVGVSSLVLSTNNGTNSGRIVIENGPNSNINLLPVGTGSVVITSLNGVLKGTSGAVGSATAADFAIVYGTQPKNYFLASPNATSGTTSFRKLTADDIPVTLNSTVIGGSLVVTGTTTTVNSNDLAVANKVVELAAISPAAPTGTVTSGSAVVTNLSSLNNIISGLEITALTGAGYVGSAGSVTLPAGTLVQSIDSATQITLNQPLTGTGGPISGVTLTTGGATDATANSGGLSLRGATDKTIIWSATTANWTSSENWNLATGKIFKINNVDVLSATALGTGITSSSLTSVGTLTGLTVQGGSGTYYAARFKGSTTGDQFGIGVSSTAGYGVGNDVLNAAGSAYAPYTISASQMTFKIGSPAPATAMSFDTSGNVTFANDLTVTGTFTGAAPAGSLTGTTLKSTVTASSLTSVGTLVNLTVTNTITGSVNGNAGTATTLQTARNINGVSFNGGADITVTAAAGTLTGTTLASGVTASSLTSVGTLSSLTTSGDITLNTNNKALKFTTTTGAAVSLIQQNDDNFVLYSTNASGAQRAIWSVFGQSNTSSFNISVPTSLSNAALTVKDVRDTVYASGSTTGTVTPDCANGNVQTVTLTGNITFNAFANAVSGQSLTMIITQPSSGGPYTLTSSMKFAGGVKTLSTAANAVDMLTVSYIGTTYYASLVTGFA
jgi:hypothetical protein